MYEKYKEEIRRCSNETVHMDTGRLPYNPQIKVKDGRRTLRNVRLLSENVRMESMDVYMGAMKNFVDGNSSQVICVQGRDMILLDTEDTEQMLQTKTYCGTSPDFTDILSLQEYFKMAEISAAYGDKTPGCINTFESCAVSYAMELIRNHAHVTISHPALSVLGRYDCKNHTELKKTLKEYLNCERNYVKTAARLYIHRNSLLYRLKRIEELTGIDLDNEEIRLHLMLSYRFE